MLARKAIIIYTLLIGLFAVCSARAERTPIGSIKYPWLEAPGGAVVSLCSKDTAYAAFLIDEEESFAVTRALGDVQEDLYDVTGRMFKITNTVPVKSFYPYLIIVGTVDSRPIVSLSESKKIDISDLKGKFEAFNLQTVKDPFPGCKGALVIAGSDMRGTIYGLYTLVQDGLEVDPLRFWTEKPVTKRESLYLGNMLHREDSPRIRYRGWFLNDEDFLKGWHGTMEHVSAEIFEPVLSTMLRLRQNMIVPQTTFNLSKPNDRRVCEMVKEWGLLLTTHHAMPLGIWGRDWDTYWKSKGQDDVEFSFIKNRGKFEEVWTSGIDSYKPYMGVWQLGLRGKSDDSIWRYDPLFPTDPAGQAEKIVEAVTAQRDLLYSKIGDKNVPVTTTMWAEVLTLYLKGVLKYPDDIILVFSDEGHGSMDHLDRLGLKEPFAEHRAGIYYHVAFQNGHDSHLVETVHPERIARAFEKVLKYNLTEYMLVNVSNIREFVMSARAVADVSYMGKFNPEEFYSRWFTQQFGGDVARDVAEAYKEQVRIPHHFGTREQDHFMVQGLARYGARLLEVARRGDTEKGQFNYLGVWHGKRSYKETLQWMSVACEEDAAEWDALWTKMLALEPKVPLERRQFYRDHMLLQCYTYKEATKWVRDVSCALLAQYDGKPDETRRLILEGKQRLQSILDMQKKSEHGKWTGYYRNDRISLITYAINCADNYLNQVQYNVLNRPALVYVDPSGKTEADAYKELGPIVRPGSYIQVPKSGVSAEFVPKQQGIRPDLVLCELASAPEKPIDVYINGVKAGSMQGSPTHWINVPKDVKVAEKISFEIRCQQQTELPGIFNLRIYGSPNSITQEKSND